MKIPTPEERAKALLRIEKQTSREVAKCFSDLVDRVISRLGAFPEGSPMTPGENPAFARLLDTELTRFAGELEEANERGVTRAWTLSDHYGDIDTRGYLRRTGATALLTSFSYSTTEADTARRAEAVRAFLHRRDRKGFTISGRVWRTAEQAMQHIETSLAEGLAEGRSAAELSRTIREDLREPHKLFRRVRDKNGILHLSKPARAFHPGTGVYRSSYKNALRLTRTEINVSYAEADFERWQRLDFVIGYEVRLSNNHTCNGHPFTDICDELAGRYPKWFKFTKWHPQCRCVCLAIFDDDPGAGEVRDVPDNFKQWVTDNQPRLDRSIKKGTAPYWVRDNFSKEGKLTGAGRKPATPHTAGGGNKPPKPPVNTTTAPADPDEERRRRTLERAKARHEARTPEEVLSVRRSWNDRQVARATGTHFEPGGMSFADADNGMGNVFHSTNKRGYRVNCQSCVVAHEMRLRGHSVTARPNTEMKNNMPCKLSRKTEMAWVDPVTKTSPVVQKAGGWTGEYNARGLVVKTVAQRKKEFLENTKPPGRYHMSFAWKGRKTGGHIVTLERKPNGDLFLYDPQTNVSIAGEGKVIDFIKERISQIYPIKTYRVDNLLADVNVVKRVVYKTMTDL